VSRVVLVTGAASGIGRRVSELLVERGDRVLALDVDEVSLRHVTRGWPEDRTGMRRLDVREPADWEAVLQEATRRWGRIDVLLNVAGVLIPGTVHETPVAAIERQMDVNAKGLMLGTRIIGDWMAKQGLGHIVNVGSLASLVPVPGIGVYSASKFAVRAYTLIAARELAPSGVAVSLLCPDLVNTPMLDAQLAHKEAALAFSGPRALTAEEVARCILDRILVTREREVWLPTYRGWLAKLSEMVPRLADTIYGVLERHGRRHQLAWVKRKGDQPQAHRNGSAPHAAPAPTPPAAAGQT
jgi:3-oxoacyl-[acyl-carrier protein] reductase